MYGDRHPLIRKSSADPFIFGMTFVQLLAVLAGGKASYELAKFVPVLPIENYFLKHIHQGLPLYITAALIFIQDNITGRILAMSVYDKCYAKIRKKVFLYQREEC